MRSSQNAWDDRSGLSDVFARRAFRPTDWHNCFGPWVLTGDLVLADNRRFPLFLHARAVALSMPEPSLGAPVPSRSLLFGEELFDRVARPKAPVPRLARVALSASRFRRRSTSPSRVLPHLSVSSPSTPTSVDTRAAIVASWPLRLPRAGKATISKSCSLAASHERSPGKAT